MEITTKTTISEIVRFNFKSVEVFEKYGIDFCCGGKKTLASVCETKNLNFEDIQNDLKNFLFVNDIFSEWDERFLIDYIVNVHHSFLKKELPVIQERIDKVYMKHSEKYPEIIKIKEVFTGLKKELEDHTNKEETILFPYIKKLRDCADTNSDFQLPPFGTIDNPIKVMEREHTDAGNALEELKALTKNFKIEDSYCNTHGVTYKELENLYKDLHIHIHLENNILFPKAIALENELTNKNKPQQEVCSCSL
ncbi:MAG TPA: iron-sulfur cluster repair di-iron protein [Ignavibacteria bacterium]|nr:iron-sulfur cluster repair di-iron protein [Ignavibacteria bacterium]